MLLHNSKVILGKIIYIFYGEQFVSLKQTRFSLTSNGFFQLSWRIQGILKKMFQVFMKEAIIRFKYWSNSKRRSEK